MLIYIPLYVACVFIFSFWSSWGFFIYPGILKFPDNIWGGSFVIHCAGYLVDPETQAFFLLFWELSLYWFSDTSPAKMKQPPFYYAQMLWVRISGKARGWWMAYLCFMILETSSCEAQMAGDGWDAQLWPCVQGLGSGLVPRFFLWHLLGLKCPRWFLHSHGLPCLEHLGTGWVTINLSTWQPQHSNLGIARLLACWLAFPRANVPRDGGGNFKVPMTQPWKLRNVTSFPFCQSELSHGARLKVAGGGSKCIRTKRDPHLEVTLGDELPQLPSLLYYLFLEILLVRYWIFWCFYLFSFIFHVFVFLSYFWGEFLNFFISYFLQSYFCFLRSLSFLIIPFL